MHSSPDYLILGHVTRDLLPDGTTTPGGTALYAALTADRLGRHVGLVSAAAPLPTTWANTIQLALQPSTDPPTFENRYTPAGRVQLLHTAAAPIEQASIPLDWQAAPIVHLGPVQAEVPDALAFAFPGALLGVTPQGWMREWPTPLPAPIAYRRWEPSAALLRRIDALILSIEDVRGDEELVRSYARSCKLVALTRGASGATLFLDGVPHDIAAYPAVERDPTGAGDVFAAALLVRLHETGDPLLAADFAACVAAASVEQPGTAGVPTRAQISARLRI